MANIGPPCWYVDAGPQIQAFDVGATTGSSGATLALANVNVPAGATIAIIVGEQTSATIGTFADSAGNTYTNATGSVAEGGSVGVAAIFYAKNVSALVNGTITYTRNVSAHLCTFGVAYGVGCDTTAPLDSAVTATSAGTTTTPSVTSGTPSVAGEWLFAGVMYGAAAARVYTQPTGNNEWIAPPQANTTNPNQQMGAGTIVYNGPLAGVTFNPTIATSVNGTAAMIVGFKPATAATPAGYNSVPKWQASHSYPVGSLVRQAAVPALGAERVFVQVNPTTHMSNTTEPAWTTTRYGSTTDSTCTWIECTGDPAVNGDSTNAITWAQQHASSTSVTVGLIIYDASTTSLQIVTTAGTIGGSAPSFSATAGVTTADNTATWTSLGHISGFVGSGIMNAPHARMSNAIAANWGAAGNDFYVGSDHFAQQNAALVLTFPATDASRNRVLSVDQTTSLPTTTMKSGAMEVTRGTNSLTMRGTGVETDGLSLSACMGSNSTASLNVGTGAACDIVMKNGALRCGTTGTGSIGLNCNTANVASYLRLANMTMQFGAVGHDIALSGGLTEWLDTPSAIQGSIIPTTLFNANPGQAGMFRAKGVDLSALGSGKTIVGANPLSQISFQFWRCATGASVTLSATPTANGVIVDFINCDNGATSNMNARFTYAGTMTTETTNVETDSNGASTGSQGYSWKITTTANASRQNPFICPELYDWAAQTGSAQTIKINSITDTNVDATALTNADLFVEVREPDGSSNPLATLHTTEPATLTAGSTLTSSSATWNTSGMTTPDARESDVTFTNALAGDIEAWIKVARPNLTTLRVNPRVVGLN